MCDVADVDNVDIRRRHQKEICINTVDGSEIRRSPPGMYKTS